MVTIDHNAFDVKMVNPEDDPTLLLNNMTTSLSQFCDTKLLESSIEDATNKKKVMVSKIDSVTSLMKEVEYQEKVAEQTERETAQIHSDIMSNVYELMAAQKEVKKKNDMLAKEAYEQKKLVFIKTEALHLHVTSLLDKGDRSLELLDEMSRSLETRLTSAMMKTKLAIKKKKENEACARTALAYEKNQMEKVEKETKRLKLEAVEISKLQEFLVERGHLVSKLHGELSDKCQDVKRLKEELDRVAPSSENMPLTRSIKKLKIRYAMKIKRKPCAQFFAKLMFAKRIKSLKIKGKLQGNVRFAKTIKKVKIIRKGPGIQMCAKSIKKPKTKGSKQHGSQMCAKKIMKIKAKRRGSKICAKSIKKLKIISKMRGNQLCPKSITQVKIKGKQRAGQMCAKSIKKVKINGMRVVKGEQLQDHEC